MFKIKIRDGAAEVIRRLQQEGHSAYIVGGCVRDSVLEKEPKDWDICTSARPDSILRTFKDEKVIATGLKHGTVTVVINGESYEVTTFRVDGVYSDNRRPDHVDFVSNIEEDLARRDFTINAMAYNDDDGLIDPFGGSADIQNRIVRCVGDADMRFQEDALRILRCLRFAADGFSVDGDTALAARMNVGLLNCIAAERINAELCKMLMGNDIMRVLIVFQDIITSVIPELAPCVGFNQNNKYHVYDVYEHIAHAVDNYQGQDLVVKLTLLLHDIGKPDSYIENETGGHFYGHGVVSRDLAEGVLDRLRFDNKTKHDVLELVLFHDSVIEPNKKVVRRWLNKIGSKQFERLMDVRLADIMAHSPLGRESRVERRNQLCELYREAIEEDSCFKLKDLAVNGRDLLALGVPEGPQIGRSLSGLLGAVMDGVVPNKKEQLLEFLKDNSLKR